MRLDFTHPLVLLMLPLALLPLLRRRSDTLAYPSVAWLPRDRAGRLLGILWRALAVAAMACTIIGMAGPGQPGALVLRSGRGAELLILMDRSSSMDNAAFLNGASYGPRFSTTESKNKIVRGLLSDFVAKRPHDRIALTTFGSSVLRVVPFTEHGDMVQAGLAATGIGRGLAETLMGKALLASIAEFEGRRYSGSRVILVVSDGGAQLDPATRERIRAGLAHEKIALYWIYIRSGPNSPDLIAQTKTVYASADEQALDDFFRTLETPYHLYQTDDAGAMAAAMAEIDRQQNLPLAYREHVPRRDFSAAFYVAAALCCAGLLAWRALQLRSWR